MALTQPIEATSKLIEYLAEIESKLSSHDSNGIDSDPDFNVEISKLFEQFIDQADQQGLFIGRPALLHILEIIGEYLSTSQASPGFGELSLSAVLPALISYLQGVSPETQIATIVSHLPAELAVEYAQMLVEESSLISTEHASSGSLAEHSQLPTIAVTGTGENILPVENSDDSLLSSDNRDVEQSHDTQHITANADNEHPIKSALNLAVEELYAFLNSGESLPDKETLDELLQDHLGNLEFVALSTGANQFLDSLALLQGWAQDVLSEPEPDIAIFLSDMLVKLSDLPFDKVGKPEFHSHSEAQENHARYLPHDFSDERLAMLYEELSEFDEQLAQQALIITAEETDGETLLECIESYSELLGRLVVASDALGMHGLKRICNFVIENVNLLPAQESATRLAVRPLLSRWSEMVKHYLTDPADDSFLMGMIDLLQDSAWPKHFDGLDGRDLYLELSRGAADEEEVVSQEPRTTHASREDVSLEPSDDINPQLFEAFLLESPDVAARFNQVISSLNISANPFDDMRSAQRLSHTLKGSANLVGVKGVANLAHHIEDILDALTRRQVAPSTTLTAVLQEAADCLESMIDTVAGRDSAPENSVDVLQRVLDVANLIDSGEYDPAADLHLSDTETVKVNPPTVHKQAPPPATTVATAASETIRVPTTTVNAMFRLVEEITISLAQVNEHVSRIKQLSESLYLQDRNLQQRRFDLENLVDVRSIAAMQKRLHKSGEGMKKFDPLEMDQYDELYGATHSYIEAVADTREISSGLHDQIQELDGFLLRQSRLNKELQQLVSATRMVPVNQIAYRLQRAVRQASRATGNPAELIIEDHNLMMDGDVLNKLVDPLLHILRNAVDHGMSQVSEASEPGHITVRFLQEGSNVVIRIADNGRGLDYQRIREVAIDRGLLRPEQEPSNDELARFIMSPSFTTRSSTTQVSGRGIGMDAVYTAVTDLKGTVNVQDVEPHGTEFVIRLPLSLVTTHSLVVQSGNNVYAIPSATLAQILPPGTGDIQALEEGHTFQLDGDIFSMYSLPALVGFDSGTTLESATILLSGHGNAAVAVDTVLQSTELVIKRLGRFVPKVTGVAGVTVLGDGRIIPVLDLPELLLAAQEGAVASSTITPQMSTAHHLRQAIKRPTALVVDDSLSARNSLSQLLEDSGYAVVTARDGVEAVELLQAEKPLVVLSDLEMPRMDGIELTRHIRSNQYLHQLPVLMITSRSQKKHRDEAEAAGVNAYLTKPFKEDELIDVVASLV